MSMAPVQDLLQKRFGLDPRSVGLASIERAVRQGMKESGAEDVEDYWRLLRMSPHKVDELLELVVVGETWFFRQPESFSWLAAKLKKGPPLYTQRNRLRILSLGCSTGEEPYSVAMMLLDMGFRPECF